MLKHVWTQNWVSSTETSCMASCACLQPAIASSSVKLYQPVVPQKMTACNMLSCHMGPSRRQTDQADCNGSIHWQSASLCASIRSLCQQRLCSWPANKCNINFKHTSKSEEASGLKPVAEIGTGAALGNAEPAAGFASDTGSTTAAGAGCFAAAAAKAACLASCSTAAHHPVP